MKSLVLVVIFLFASTAIAQDNVVDLRNADILAMIAAKVPTDAIITKIRTSSCNFDTFPTMISELRYRGVPEEILVAMVEAPVGSPTRKPQKQPEAAAKRTDTPEQPEKSVTANVESTGKDSDASVSGATKKPIDAAASPEKGATQAVKVSKLEPKSSTRIEQPRMDATALKEKPKESSQVAEQKILTNDDVMKLLRSGLANADLAATIRTARGKYDFSAQALHALQEAGADAVVFLAMMEVSRRRNDVPKPEDNKPRP